MIAAPSRVSDAPSAGPQPSGRVVTVCFHCGEPCAGDAFAQDGKPFCCLGCQTVFHLLQENGLGQFYELNAAPGTRIRATTVAARYAFLDDPVVREKLLDYADDQRARVTLRLPAIHCVACVWLLENLFKLHPGIGRSVVNFTRREATITFAPDRIKLGELAALLASIGYEPELTCAETEAPRPSLVRKKQWLQIGLAAFAFGNIMLMSVPVYLGLDRFNGPWFRVLAGWLSLAMALPVVTYSASDFWRSAWWSLRQRRLTLDVPIALGLAAIYGQSFFEVLAHRGPGYCDSLTGLILFLLCGRVFQQKTHERLIFDRDYKGFFPLAVIRKTPAGEESVPISRLQPGDRLVLRHGELLPADAKLVGGDAWLDYSFVTGEAEPVRCAPGSHLYAGGRQIGGRIEVETVRPVVQSRLAALWDNEAFRKRRDDDLDSLTNRYSRRFTKLVIGLALAAAVFWLFHDAAKALPVFTAVLIVACPCALALAAPLTHGTAQRVLARLNLFLKNARVIERLAQVDTIVLDKTGTLTTADASGVAFISAEGGVRKADLSVEERQWIGSLARHSTHPNSIRIAKSLAVAPRPVSGFQEISGGGIAGEVAGHEIRLGSMAWLEKCGVSGRNRSNPEGSPSAATTLPVGSHTGIAIDGVWRGGFQLENALRPEVEKLVARLGSRFELALLSGDNEREAARFRALFGERATLRFNRSPADKLEFIRELQHGGRRVMMVGDGLNDAGALRQADVGVAVVESLGAFSPASDVILDALQLPRLAEVLAFSRQAARVVRLGFVISALYNLAGLSIAAAGLLAPMVCAVLMPLSSATVLAFACGMTAWSGRRIFALSKPLGASTSPARLREPAVKWIEGA
ncbi:MAG TPA: heavy metal translocating P-type ATPase metal-binding domain-containing protein [Candidatus Acidoferrum sp.]|nr:heavy metal translocating P-type ATPase metal-binding domain-containing protein [Candidatus Acidoferrum sp.]